MNIRKKLALKFCFIVGTLFVFFSFFIYYFSSLYRETEFQTRLKNRGITIVQLLDKVDEIDIPLLNAIDSNTKNSLFYEDISIFSLENKLIYTYGQKETIKAEILDKVGQKSDLSFFFGNKQAVGFVYYGDKDDYKVIVTAYDQLGYDELRSLRIILIVGALLSFLCSYMAGWVFSGHALNPIAKIVSDMNKITASRLDVRLDEGRGQDEIERLSITFNKMLDRLEKAFGLQRRFISNASHELRTPLTSMKGHIEVTLKKERDIKEYIETLILLSDEVENLKNTSNNLLQLAQASSDAGALKLTKTRIDELIFSSREELLKAFPSYKINILFINLPENDLFLSIAGNEQLIKSAFYNLMENACKYSKNETVTVSFKADGKEIELLFKDEGIGIPPEEITKIFQPFYRASNSTKKSGSGLGLPLTKEIVELHKGSMEINSKLNIGTEVRLLFPSVSSSH